MKYIVKFMLAIFMFFGLLNFVSADTENLLYKHIAITNMEIKNIYGETKGKAIVKALDTYFTKIRARKDTAKLTKLKNRVKPTVDKLTKKTRLTRNEKVLNTLAKNIYFRARVISEYLLD